MANLEYFSDEDVISFTLLDAHTVERLQRDGDIKLPRKKVDIPKDERWNTKQMSSKLLQGILAGDAIPTIANSLMQVIGNNAAAAVRNARTMVTGAENVGRLDSYEDLAEKGVVQKKVWIATADDRTRESHLLLDGEEVDIDKPFSNGLMYPADPSGDPAEVYNCRCSMRDHIVGFRRADGSISYVGAERDDTTHERQMEEEKKRRENISDISQSEENIVVGVNINIPNYDVFSNEFKDIIPQLADDIENSELPTAKELNILYRNAQTPQDEELVEFVGSLASNVLSFKDESKEMQRYHAEIFSVLSKPHDGALFRGESGEWVKHYGDFTVGKEISFEHLSFTTPDIDGTPSHHTGVIFEFKDGTKSINFVGQDNVENDELILGNFIIESVEELNGVPRVVLKQRE